MPIERTTVHRNITLILIVLVFGLVTAKSIQYGLHTDPIFYLSLAAFVILGGMRIKFLKMRHESEYWLRLNYDLVIVLLFMLASIVVYESTIGIHDDAYVWVENPYKP